MDRIRIPALVIAGLVVLGFVLFLFFGGLAKGVVEEAMIHPHGVIGTIHVERVINQSGEYPLPGCDAVLIVEVRDLIVHFAVLDTAGKHLFTSGHPEISAVHKWHMVINDSCAISIYSSDIGNYWLHRVPGIQEYLFSSAQGMPTHGH